MAAGLATRELADDRTFADEIVRNPRDEGCRWSSSPA
jgi:hypothetical protein